jgi:translation initiation factor 3 subunit D
MSFVIPEIRDNENGWGPCGEGKQWTDVPYAPYKKSDRIGRAADWTQSHYHRFNNRFNNANGQEQAVNEAFNFKGADNSDDKDFEVVVETSKRHQSRRGGHERFSSAFYYTGKQRRGGYNNSGNSSNAHRHTQGKAAKHLHRPQKGKRHRLARQRYASYRRWSNRDSLVHRDPSVAINEATWRSVGEFEFAALTALKPIDLRGVAVERVAECGQLARYDKSLDRVTTRNERLLRHNRGAQSAAAAAAAASSGAAPAGEALPPLSTSSSDPVLAKLATQSAGNVFVTDELLSLIMTAERTKRPWDLVLTRRGEHLFIDKRPGSSVDRLTVDENATEPPTMASMQNVMSAAAAAKNPSGAAANMPVNSEEALSAEATRIDAAFRSQALLADADADAEEPFPVRFDEPSPFALERSVSRAYRYQRVSLGADIVVVVRSTIDAVRTVRNKHTLTTVRALNQYMTTADNTNWRVALDNQRAAVIAVEAKNNASKMARWVIEATVADAETLVLGFVGRANSTSSTSHVILGTHPCRPSELASQIGVDMAHAWAVVQEIAAAALALPAGKYSLLREPNNPALSLYRVPDAETFARRSADDAQEISTLDALPSISLGGNLATLALKQ